MMHIPIALATDNNYMPLVVTMTSLVRNAGKDTFYDIYILTDRSLTMESRRDIEEYFRGYQEQCSVKFIDIEETFDNASLYYEEITRPTYYRLALPELLSEDRCIYLDTDTIAVSDMRELYEVPLEGFYVAGVRHPMFILSSVKDEYCKTIGIPDMEQYINAGVLVFNLKEMRKDRVMRKFLEAVSKNMPTQDQDIINNVCYGKIVPIPPQYNVMTKLSDWNLEDYQGIYSASEWREAWNKPCIIHYADSYKPWNCLDCVFMEYWWNVCKMSPVFKRIAFMKGFIWDAIYCGGGTIFTKKMPRIFDITYQRKYVIYGAGKKARKFIAFIKEMGIIPEFIAVSDGNSNPLEVEGITVRDIGETFSLLYDKTIIIATQEKLHKEIIKKLQECDYLELLPLSDRWEDFEL